MQTFKVFLCATRVLHVRKCSNIILKSFVFRSYESSLSSLIRFGYSIRYRAYFHFGGQ